MTTDTTGASRQLAAGVFVVIGHTPRTELVKDQLKLDGEGCITVDSPTTVTNLLGVFSCGDAVDHRNRHAITAAGTGCAAALAGDRTAADDVQLVLPETGVCSTDLGGSCDLPAPGAAEQGCCAPDATKEPADACCSGPQPVTIGAAPVH